MQIRIAIFVIFITLILQSTAYGADTDKSFWHSKTPPVKTYSLISFSHKFHTDEVGSACMDCHANYKRPKMEVCSDCHEGTATDMPVLECMKCHMRLDFGGLPPKPTY